MKKCLYIILIMMVSASCEEDVPETPDIRFRIQIDGFEMYNAYPEHNIDHDSFTHKLSGGVVKFTSNNRTYNFNTEDTSIDKYNYELPVGNYLMEILTLPASLHGQKSGSFKTGSQMVAITQQTDTVLVEVKPTCALFLVSDEFDQLDNSAFMIERYSIGEPHCELYPLSRDTLSGLYYTYFTPDPKPSDPNFYLWLHKRNHCIGGEGLSTIDCEIGYTYYFVVLD